MKKIKNCITILFVMFSYNVQSQIIPDSIKVKNGSCFEVFMNDMSAQEKMSMEKSWISKNFGDYKSVLQYEDETKNTIVIKGHLELYASEAEAKMKKLERMMGQATDKRNMYFTIEFSNKDDRYRVKISDITIKASMLVAYGGGFRSEQTYEEWTDQGVLKATQNLNKLQNEIDSLKSVRTDELKPNEIKKLKKEIAEIEEDIDKNKEKLENKLSKSKVEQRWLNSNLAIIFNSINNHMQKTTDDDF